MTALATLAAATRTAQRSYAATTAEQRSDTLRSLATILEEREDEIIAANERDLQRAQSQQIAAPLLGFPLLLYPCKGQGSSISAI